MKNVRQLQPSCTATRCVRFAKRFFITIALALQSLHCSVADIEGQALAAATESVRGELASESAELRTYANEWGEGIFVSLSDSRGETPVWIYVRGAAYSLNDAADKLTPRVSPLKNASPEIRSAARLDDISLTDIRNSIRVK
jgi:hypothetical protein